MSSGLLLAELAVLWLGILLAASLMAAPLYPVYRRLAGGSTPPALAAGILTYGLLPALSASLAVLLLMQPELAGALVPPHCHAGNCSPHPPELGTQSIVGTALIAFAAMVTSGVLILLLQHGLRQRQRTKTLKALSDPADDNRFRVVNSPELLAWCSGLWRPRTYVCQGLIDRLTPAELQVVLAHERAHGLQLDNLRRALLHWSTLFWPAALRRRIRADFAAACEQACDSAAVRQTGDAARVMRVIEQLGNTVSTPLPAHHTAFANTQWQARIKALQQPAAPDNYGVNGWMLIALLWMNGVSLLAYVAHPLLEWLTR